MNAKEFAASLKNIGPVTAVQLIKAGIDTPEKLRKLGAKEAFVRIYEAGAYQCGTYHAAYLYALEGAIMDCDWRKIPNELKEESKAFAEELRLRVF